MTAAPRRRRHDPLAARPAPAGSSRPARRRSTCIPTRPARTASSRPARSSRQAAAVGVRLLALTDHDTLAGYREVLAAGAVPAGLTLDPGRGDQRDRHARPRAVGGRAPHPRLRDGPRRRGLRGDPRRPARPAPRALREDGRPAARARPVDRRRRSPRSTGADDDALGRPTVARALDRGRPRGERRGRVHATARLGQAGVRAARAGSARSRRSRRSAPPAGSRCSPISARRRRGSRSSASWSMPGSAGSRSTTARSTSATVARSARWRRRSAWSPTGGQRLPRRHGHLRRGARRAVGPARGGRRHPRGRARS